MRRRVTLGTMKRSSLCGVLGADGFIGSHLVHALVARDFRVRAIDKFPNGRSLNLEQIRNRIEMVSADLFCEEDLDTQFLEGVEYLFHFATPSTPASSLLDPIREFRNHLLPTLRLFDMASQNGVRRVIFASSGGTVYGPAPKCPATENSVLQPVFPHSIVKVALEYYLAFLRLRGLDSIVYRIANPYGPRQRGWMTKQGVISVFLRAALLDEPVQVSNDKNAIRDYIFVGDLTEAILKSFWRPHKHHVYNIGSGIGTDLQTIIRLIEKTTRKRLKKTTEKAPVAQTSRIVLNIGRIQREFHWQPQLSLLQGIRRTWEWIRDQEFATNYL